MGALGREGQKRESERRALRPCFLSIQQTATSNSDSPTHFTVPLFCFLFFVFFVLFCCVCVWPANAFFGKRPGDKTGIKPPVLIADENLRKGVRLSSVLLRGLSYDPFGRPCLRDHLPATRTDRLLSHGFAPSQMQAREKADVKNWRDI